MTSPSRWCLRSLLVIVSILISGALLNFSLGLMNLASDAAFALGASLTLGVLFGELALLVRFYAAWIQPLTERNNEDNQ